MDTDTCAGPVFVGQALVGEQYKYLGGPVFAGDLGKGFAFNQLRVHACACGELQPKIAHENLERQRCVTSKELLKSFDVQIFESLYDVVKPLSVI